MSKSFAHRLTSNDVATVLEVPHDRLLEVVADLVEQKFVGSTRLIAPAGQPWGALLDLLDLAFVVARLSPESARVQALLRLWRDESRAASPENTELSNVRSASILADVFGGDSDFLSAVRRAAAGEMTERETAATYGFRVSDSDPKLIHIAPAHPYIKHRAWMAGATTREINDEMRELELGERGVHLKMGGKLYRASHCSLEHFVARTESHKELA